MIYTIFPEKDTYISNRFLSTRSNVGRAATLDIFKLNNENSSVKSWAIIDLNSESLPVVGDSFTLKDTFENTVIFEFTAGPNNELGETITNGTNIKIGLDNFNSDDLATQIKNIINNVTLNQNNGQTLSIEASTINSTILLEQSRSGELGDTNIETTGSGNLVVTKSFSRLEYSNLLLKFSLDKFKNDIIKNFSKSVFSDKNKFKAEIELVDISLGHTKPFNYDLKLYPLSKSFDEGLGKDTILFDDEDICNFFTASYDKSTNSYITWSNQKILLNNNDFYTENESIDLTSLFHIEKGDENITFDVTEYFHQFLNNKIEDKGFVIRLGESSLFNDYSYFVKRLGSKHLLNKKFIPKLNIKINEDLYYLSRNSDSLSRYFDTEHSIYLYNSQGGIFKSLITPPTFEQKHFSASLKYNNFELYKKGIDESNGIFKYTNLFGEEVPGIYGINILDNDISRFNQELSTDIESSTSGSVNFDLEWYWFKEGNTPEKRTIKKETVVFKIPESDEILVNNIVSKVTVNSSKLIANNTIQKLSVFFINTNKEYKASRKPYDIKCENLGVVHVKVIDTYDDSILINYDTDYNSTKLFFNGKDYEYNFFIPDIFKNKIVRFEFLVVDKISGTENLIRNSAKIKVQ